MTHSPIVLVLQMSGERVAHNKNLFKGTGIMKRQSTTAKVTRETAKLIGRYTESTGSGVMIRYKGEHFGVVGTFEDDRFFQFHRGDYPTDAMASHCTILKSTLAALKTWDYRVSELYRLISLDCKDGTVGNAAGRYVVSEPNGLLFDDRPLATPSMSKFADDTLGAETVGVWHDNGKVYVDSNASFDRLSDALDFGRSSGQLAIYDTVDCVCIDC